ncbi:MAG: hypothetical protein ABSD85_06800 [Acidimicrobiales bacterium]|jgi:ABC-type glucose/galactose transport system permease subunit
MGSEVVQTPSEVMAKATRMLKRVMLLQMVWFGCFLTGGVLVLWTAWKNTHLPASCPSPGGPPQTAPLSVIESCQHHSYLLAVVLVLIGIAGLFVTGYVATRLAVKYLGAGAAAFLRGGRRFMGPMGPRPGGPDMGGGFPGSGGMQGFNPGLPPASPPAPPPHDDRPGHR